MKEKTEEDIVFAFSGVQQHKEIKFSNKQYRSYLVSIKNDKIGEFSGKHNEMIKFRKEGHGDMVARNNAYMLNNKEFLGFFR